MQDAGKIRPPEIQGEACAPFRQFTQPRICTWLFLPGRSNTRAIRYPSAPRLFPHTGHRRCTPPPAKGRQAGQPKMWQIRLSFPGKTAERICCPGSRITPQTGQAPGSPGFPVFRIFFPVGWRAAEENSRNPKANNASAITTSTAVKTGENIAAIVPQISAFGKKNRFLPCRLYVFRIY